MKTSNTNNTSNSISIINSSIKQAARHPTSTATTIAAASSVVIPITIFSVHLHPPRRRQTQQRTITINNINNSNILRIARLQGRAVDVPAVALLRLRVPEILLGLPFSKSIDVWSLGCVMAELFLGWSLYLASSEYDQLRYICPTQGSPPEHMLRAATKTQRLFNCRRQSVGHHSYDFWRLKTPDEHEAETATKSNEALKYIFNCLEEMAQINVPNELEGVEPTTQSAFTGTPTRSRTTSSSTRSTWS